MQYLGCPFTVCLIILREKICSYAAIVLFLLMSRHHQPAWTTPHFWKVTSHDSYIARGDIIMFGPYCSKFRQKTGHCNSNYHKGERIFQIQPFHYKHTWDLVVPNTEYPQLILQPFRAGKQRLIVTARRSFTWMATATKPQQALKGV